ncbi:MAG: hypothetical protein GYA31_01540 [Parcubacteria group bacterium]|nr:hypothetical protein [Parcubacteria group bacterium]
MKRKILKYLLWVLAKLTLWRYRPLIIAVAGSTGKSSTKEAIYYALKNDFKVARSISNLNTEIGLPLTIINGYDAKNNIFLWLVNIIKTLFLVIFKNKNYPQIWVLEMSEDQPGLITYLSKLCHPQIGVLSWISETPVHVEFYPNKESLQEEIQQLIVLLPSSGTAVLNYDNPLCLSSREQTKARVITYGFDNNSTVKISDYSLILNENLSQTGMKLRFEYQGSYVPFKINGVFGKAQAYALASGVAVGLALNLNLVHLVESLSEYKLLKARTHLIKGIKNTWILEDSYNSNPDALRASLDLYQDLVSGLKEEKIYPVKRRILVLGDMRELGKYSEGAHRLMAPLIKENADILITVGPKMKMVVSECLKLGFPQENIYSFESSKEAGQ